MDRRKNAANKNKWVVGIGEALWDVLPDGRQIGGAPANFAYHVSQFGLRSCAVSAVGDDPDGEELRRQFNDRGVENRLDVVPFPTGRVEVTVDAEGIPVYEIREGCAWDKIPFTADLGQLARQTDAVCFGTLAQRDAVSRLTIRRFLESMPDNAASYKIFDINLRQTFYSKEVVEDSLTRCNVLKINDEELEKVSRMFGLRSLQIEEQCRELLDAFSLRLVILTCGAVGSYVITPETTSYIETPHVEVVDTVGAGDSFTATFISSLLWGGSIFDAHRLAVEVSAYVCTQPGAMPKLPETLIAQVCGIGKDTHEVK